MIEAPKQVWIDDRVARTMGNEPADTPGIKLKYVRSDVLEEMILKIKRDFQAQIPEEYVTQIETVWKQVGNIGCGSVIALTNLGRIFEQRERNDKSLYWAEVEGPVIPDGFDPGPDQ